jgi:hypothetical protein
MLDAELENAIAAEFPQKGDVLFISSVAEKRLDEMKDHLRRAITAPFD